VLYVLDSSALVKRYHREPGTDLVDQLFEDPANLFLISVLSLSEMTRVLERLQRQGVYSLGDIRMTQQRLYRDCQSGRIGLVEVTRAIALHANELILQFHLSAADAVMLATALHVQSHQPVFVTADTRSGLLQAAQACHLATVNPIGL